VEARYFDSWRDPDGTRLVAVSPSGRSFLEDVRSVRSDLG
jgi:hypothetical protein